MIIFLKTLWAIKLVKDLLFWLYLWQLKEYHWGRFREHFKTKKGRKILFRSFQPLKLLGLLLLFLPFPLFNTALLFILFVYFVENIFFFKKILLRRIKKPVFTFKIVFLCLLNFIFVFSFLKFINSTSSYLQLIYLIIYDLFFPVFVSFSLWIVQPFFILVRKILLRKAQRKLEEIRSHTGLIVIGITGSYGKTSTKEFLSTILSFKYKVLATKEHQNAEIAIANTILERLQPDHQIFIAEIGAYDKGKVKEVCQILKPDIGVVTGVNEQHLALFRSMEKLLSAEGGGELSDALVKNKGILVVNGENKYCRDLLKQNNLPFSQERIYTLEKIGINADLWVEEWKVEKERVIFTTLNKKGEMGFFEVSVLGKHNIQNLLAAILVASELGMKLEEIIHASSFIKPEQGGIVLRKGKYGINIIDSSYSANPSGVLADLEYLSIFPGKRAVVMPCLIELGERSKEIHQEIGEKIAKVCQLAVITSQDYFKEIKRGFLQQGGKEESIVFSENPQEILNKITFHCKEGDAVLLEGRIPKEVISLLQ